MKSIVYSKEQIDYVNSLPDNLQVLRKLLLEEIYLREMLEGQLQIYLDEMNILRNIINENIKE